MLATGAVIGATALFAPAALGAEFQVTELGDAGDGTCDATCTLRDAVVQANAHPTGDRITFASNVTGTIRLTSELQVYESDAIDERLTIEGPGASVLTISGDANGDGVANAGDSRILRLTNEDPVTVSGVTLSGGFAPTGGAVSVSLYSDLRLEDAVVTGNVSTHGKGAIAASGDVTVTRSLLTDNKATDGAGGAIGFDPGILWSGAPNAARLTVTDSTISGNSAWMGGGGVDTYGPATITGTTISGNSATAPNQGGGGIRNHGQLAVVSSTISGNTAVDAGAGILSQGTYAPLTIRGSEISGNSGRYGSGVALLGFPGSGASSEISDTTISGNDAWESGAGVFVGKLPPSRGVTISRSTISGNDAGSGTGGGLTIEGGIEGEFELSESTISGNVAHSGAGVQIGTNRLSSPGYAQPGSIEFSNSTIASNTAVGSGGGIRLEAYPADPNDPSSDQISPTIPLRSTIVADNAPQDLERVPDSTSGGFDLTFSLVEQPGNAPLFQHAEQPSIVGQDPQLGPLADNGGATFTHLPAPTSPAVENGQGDQDATDQRGLARVVDGEGDNAFGGDGADIGAVELQDPPANPMPGTNQLPPDGPGVDLRPLAVITSNGLAARKRRYRVVAGKASDDRRVAAVEVAIVRKHGRLCKQLRANARFTKYARCSGPTVFHRAKGTTKWRFRLKHRLARGRYVVYARAIDEAGQAQLTFGSNNRRAFRVRAASATATPHTAICSGPLAAASAAGLADVVDCR